MVMRSVRLSLSSFGFVLFLSLFSIRSTISFQISSSSTRTSPASFDSIDTKSVNSFSSPPSRSKSSIGLYGVVNDADEDVATTDDAADRDDGTPGLWDAAGILGTAASIVVLRSEFVLKTTGCGLPAGPFGIVGAIEGISYLGVVATCAASVVDLVASEDGASRPKTVAGRVAAAMSFAAVLVGITVLAFQLTDYGYIPNAVPMEGGMCE
ncbi:unnamed protein product [Pseudo-nitzschia multistriata]|uniref:Uncharacterized protein n=1 Tax=Pseudo-nitzschia multistriata TaxID=183589 RepID=A0A448ZF97_9STRA|nr:unnamed protein product [Pseudo-nitzschia multistriata]